MPDPCLIVDAVSKTRGRIKAVRDVSFTVHEGEFVALVGPNAAGKTTLVQMLTGLVAPDSGRIEVAGVDLARNPVAALRGVGVVFQEPTLDLDLGVQANLRFHAGLHGLPRAEATRCIEDALARFGLSDRARDRARTLSGGNRRRLEVARALLHRPRLLVMDEATVGLDPDTRSSLISGIRALTRSDGTAVVWTTHLMDEVRSTDRTLRMSEGRLAERFRRKVS